MKDLLKGSRDIGSIRRRLVNIDGSVHSPGNLHTLLDETPKSGNDKVRLNRNPAEAAFFLWVDVARLQPFEDGNKRAQGMTQRWIDAGRPR